MRAAHAFLPVARFIGVSLGRAADLAPYWEDAVHSLKDLATVLPEGKRNFTFGLYYAGYGVGWLIGSVVTGLLYEQSRLAPVIFAIAAQLISLPIFVLANRLRT